MTPDPDESLVDEDVYSASFEAGSSVASPVARPPSSPRERGSKRGSPRSSIPSISAQEGLEVSVLSEVASVIDSESVMFMQEEEEAEAEAAVDQFLQEEEEEATPPQAVGTCFMHFIHLKN